MIIRPEYMLKIENIEPDPPTFLDKHSDLLQAIGVVMLLIISLFGSAYSVQKAGTQGEIAFAIGFAAGRR